MKGYCIIAVFLQITEQKDNGVDRNLYYSTCRLLVDNILSGQVLVYHGILYYCCCIVLQILQWKYTGVYLCQDTVILHLYSKQWSRKIMKLIGNCIITVLQQIMEQKILEYDKILNCCSCVVDNGVEQYWRIVRYCLVAVVQYFMEQKNTVV